MSPEPLTVHVRPAVMSLAVTDGKVSTLPAARLFVRLALLSEERSASGWVKVKPWSPTKAIEELFWICTALAIVRSPPRAKIEPEPRLSRPVPRTVSPETPSAPALTFVAPE